MTAYAATGRIERASPHLVTAGSSHRDADARALAVTQQDESVDPVVDLTAVDARDPLAERLAAARERWSQLTFYLFDPEGWR